MASLHFAGERRLEEAPVRQGWLGVMPCLNALQGRLLQEAAVPARNDQPSLDHHYWHHLAGVGRRAQPILEISRPADQPPFHWRSYSGVADSLEAPFLPKIQKQAKGRGENFSWTGQ